MPKKAINIGTALGPYSSAIVAGNHCYVAGTGGFLPGTNRLVDGGIKAEIEQTLRNLESVITEAGFRVQDIVSATCYLRNMEDWPLLNEIYATYFDAEPPARAAVAVADMPARSNIEITCIAWREETA